MCSLIGGLVICNPLIGVYYGVVTLETHGIKKDYIQISYLGNDKVYVPVEKIDTILYRYMFDQDFLKDSLWLALSSLVEEQYNTMPISINLITQEKNEKVLKKIWLLKAKFFLKLFHFFLELLN